MADHEIVEADRPSRGTAQPPAQGGGTRSTGCGTVLAAVAPAVRATEVIHVPSGQPVTHLDTITGEAGPAGPTVRFRFLAPQVARDAGTMPFAMVEADMAHLCETFALPRLANLGPQVSQIVITLMDRPVPFGTADPEATQFFEAYRPEDGRCVWEGF